MGEVTKTPVPIRFGVPKGRKIIAQGFGKCLKTRSSAKIVTPRAGGWPGRDTSGSRSTRRAIERASDSLRDMTTVGIMTLKCLPG